MVTDMTETFNKTPTFCGVCHYEDRQSVHLVKSGFSIFRCGNCGVLFVFPQPEKEVLQRLYTADYFSRGGKYAMDRGKDPVDVNRHNETRRIQLLTRLYPARGKLLDVGCATGGFLEVALSNGFDVSGVETSPFAAEWTRHRLNISVTTGVLTEAQLPENYYDCITFWDVLSNLPNPSETMVKAHHILKKDGLLVLSTGDTGSLWSKMTGKNWQLFTPPEHLFFYNRKSLENLLGRGGFTLLNCYHFGKKHTLKFIFLKAREHFGGIFYPMSTLVSRLRMNHIAITLNLGDMITCIAKKQ